MRIMVETEREAFDVSGLTAITVKVNVDGKEERGLTQTVTEDELRGTFDILWEYMGKRLKADIEKS